MTDAPNPRERIEKFLAEWAKGSHTGNEIYSLHTGTDREAELTVSDLRSLLGSAPNPSAAKTAFSVDDLAQEIRRVDGSHSLGAGALAEALWPFLSLYTHPQPSLSVGLDREEVLNQISDLCTSFNDHMHDVDDVLGQINQLAYAGMSATGYDSEAISALKKARDHFAFLTRLANGGVIYEVDPVTKKRNRRKLSEVIASECDAGFKHCADAILALSAPAEGYVLVPVEKLEVPAIRHLISLLMSGETRSQCREEYLSALRELDGLAMIAACLPAAPTGETGA